MDRYMSRSEPVFGLSAPLKGDFPSPLLVSWCFGSVPAKMDAPSKGLTKNVLRKAPPKIEIPNPGSKVVHLEGLSPKDGPAVPDGY